jgi:hypothetical protein
LLRYYSHAAPFRRTALDEVWQRCRGPRCAAGREQAEEQLGVLDVEVAARPSASE